MIANELTPKYDAPIQSRKTTKRPSKALRIEILLHHVTYKGELVSKTELKVNNTVSHGPNVMYPVT